MISACNQNMAVDEIARVGSDFASTFYAAFTGKPDARAFRRLFDGCSTFTFVQHCGRTDRRMTGADAIAEFADRMRYDQCTATVRSVTTTRVRPTWFEIAAVCDLLRRRSDVPCRFSQTIVVRRVAWTRAEYVVVDTSFEFDDHQPLRRTVDDDVFKEPSGGSLLDRLRAARVRDILRNTEECSADIVIRTFSREPTCTAAATTGGRRHRTSNRTDNVVPPDREVRAAVIVYSGAAAAANHPPVPKHRSAVAAVKQTTTNGNTFIWFQFARTILRSIVRIISTITKH